MARLVRSGLVLAISVPGQLVMVGGLVGDLVMGLHLETVTVLVMVGKLLVAVFSVGVTFVNDFTEVLMTTGVDLSNFMNDWRGEAMFAIVAKFLLMDGAGIVVMLSLEMSSDTLVVMMLAFIALFCSVVTVVTVFTVTVGVVLGSCDGSESGSDSEISHSGRASFRLTTA